MADGDDVEMPRVLTLLWGREETGRRGPKPGQNIRDIGSAAVQLADAEGLGAVSMSRVAKELALTTMALYRYVDSKDELFIAMIDSAYGEPPPAKRSSAGWRKRLELWAAANRDALARHPWIVQIPITGPPLSPNALMWMERGLQAFDGTPLSMQEKLSSLLLAEVYCRGQVQLSTQLHGADPDASRAADEVYIRRLGALIDPDRFPGITAAMLSGSLQDDPEDFADDEFLFGLQTVLDGIAALIDRRTRGGRRRQPG